MNRCHRKEPRIQVLQDNPCCQVRVYARSLLWLLEGEGDKTCIRMIPLHHKNYSLKSSLELEYEKYYKKFIITPARGSETGAKKRYAGLLVDNGSEKLEFVGMEFVRSDWTKLAKVFQVELYNRVFHNEEVEGWIRELVNKVKNGEYDDKLVYRKRLRKDVEDYTKNIPQHVKAARMIGETSGTVYYVITKRGPVPIELKHNDIDYEHYIEKQLKPVADSVLSLLGISFESIVQSDQLSFF